jgi:hypothetical protein
MLVTLLARICDDPYDPVFSAPAGVPVHEDHDQDGVLPGGAPGGRTLNQWIKSSPAQYLSPASCTDAADFRNDDRHCTYFYGCAVPRLVPQSTTVIGRAEHGAPSRLQARGRDGDGSGVVVRGHVGERLLAGSPDGTHCQRTAARRSGLPAFPGNS